MKIGIITERMLTGFGVDMVVHNLSENLVKLGNEVTVYAIREDGTFRSELYDLKLIPSPQFNNPIKTELHAAKRLLKLNSEDIDVWIVETYPFFPATWLLKRPVIIANNGISSSKGMSFKNRLVFSYMSFMNRFIYFPRAKRVISLSNYLKNIEFPTKNKTNVVYLGMDHVGKDITEKEQLDIRKKVGINNDDILILSVGRLNHKAQPYKGVADLIQIYKNVKTKNNYIKLLMVGFGTEEDEEYLKSEGILVWRSAPQEDLNNLFAASDIFVSTSKWEGFGMPILEAQYHGTPTVAYNVTGHKETSINNEHGFLVNSSEEFESKILELAKNKNLREQIGEKAKKNGQGYKWSVTAQKYNDILTKYVVPVDKGYHKDYIDIIILNYNGKESLKGIFDSIAKQTYKQINTIMVDNGSKDDSVTYVSKNYKWVKIIKSKTNLFFSKGNNLAVSQSDSEFIMFINNDIILDKDCVQNALNTYKDKINKHHKIAAIAVKMMLNKHPGFIDSAGVAMNPEGSPFNIGIGQYDIGQYDIEQKVFGACFGCVLIPRRLYEGVIGKLDNDYYGYFEDVDWCFRAQSKGFSIFYSPNAIAYHDHSATSKLQTPDWKYFLIHRNYLRTIEKNFAKRNALKLTLKKLKAEFFRFILSRKFVSLKVIMAYMLGFPKFYIKRIPIQLYRVADDAYIFSFSGNQRPFFDPVEYKPDINFENLWDMLLNKCLNTNDEKSWYLLFELYKIRLMNGVIKNNDFNSKIDKILKSLNELDEDVKQIYIDNIVRK